MSKIQIRRGVFETNSSSTHSLQLLHKDSEDLLQNITEQSKIINHVYRSNEFEDTENWIENGVLKINHMNLIYSDYSRSYYYIFKSLISKVHFIGMLYFGTARKFFDIKGMEVEEIIEKMKALPIFEELNNIIIKAFKKHGYPINSIDWNVKKIIGIYYYTYNNKWENLFKKKDIDNIKFLNIFKRILKDDYSVSFADIADFETGKTTYII